MTFPLAIVTQLLLNGIWTPITSDTLQRDSIKISRGRPDEASTVEPSRCDLTLNNQSGDYSPRNPNGTHFGVLGRNTPLRVLTPDGLDPYMAVPGQEEAYAWTPDVASLDITGDLDIRIEIDPRTWRPSGGYGLTRKYVVNLAQRSWVLSLRDTGILEFLWSPDGTLPSRVDTASTAAVPAGSGRLALRVTLDVDNGAAGNDVKFYTAPTIAGSWTQLGATVTTPGVTSVFAGTADLEVGRTDGPSRGGTSFLSGITYDALQGQVYAFELRSGIAGSLVASPDFTAADSGDTSLTDAQGLVWTLNGNAVMANPNARFHGELSSLPQKWDSSGTDVYTPVQAQGVLRRLGQGAAPLSSTMYRGITSMGSSVVAYWPCEDGDDATELASALPGKPPMLHPSGEIENASFSGFRASSPLPTASNVQWTGTVPGYSLNTPRAIQVRFLMAVPAAGVAGTSTVCRVRASGSAPRWDLDVDAAGDLRLQAFDSEDVQIEDSGVTASSVNGRLLRVSIELEHDGSGNVVWSVGTLEVGATSSSSFGGTLNTRTVDRAVRIAMNVGTGMDDVALGHISVQREITTIFDLSAENPADPSGLNAYIGERATDRILRLCRQEGLPVTLVGDVHDATLLGAQLPKTLLDLLREAADSDLGVLYEPREHLGLAYRTRSSLYAQDAALALDYASADLFSIEPVEDDRTTRNDITVKRENGSSARVELTDGVLSVNAPPDGVGRYDEEVTISLSRDAELPNQAGWRLHLGTVDEARYPVLELNLARANFTSDAALTADAQTLDIGGKVTVTNLPAWLPPEDVTQLAQGFTETLTRFDWLIEVNCSPGSPWDVGVWDDDDGPGEARYSSDGSTLVSGSALRLTGVSPGRASTPDTAALDIIGDIDIRVHVAMDDWSPAAAQVLFSKSVGTGNQESWWMSILAGGTLRLTWTADGATDLAASSTAAPTVVDGEALWVRVTLDVDNGAAGRTTTFYTSRDGETWTQLGSAVVTAGVTSIFSGTAPLDVGSRNTGTSTPMTGRVFAAQVRNGIAGTIVANPDFGAQPAAATSFVDSTGLTWTITAPAVLEGTTILVGTPTGPLWGDADQPYDLYVGGERLTVSAVTGTTTPQVFTVTRAVNGVVKTHASGTEVRLFKPAIYAL